jgi:AcrR family transcriptional regulator
LAEEIGLAEIDVSGITRQAALSRSTFYLHYPDKESLIEDALERLLLEITEAGRVLLADPRPDLVRFGPAWHDTLFIQIAARPALFQQLLGESAGNAFGSRLRKLHEDGFVVLWKRLGYEEPAGGPPLRVCARFAAAGVQGMIMQWLESGMIESPDILADWVWNLSFPRHQIAADGRREMHDGDAVPT